MEIESVPVQPGNEVVSGRADPEIEMDAFFSPGIETVPYSGSFRGYVSLGNELCLFAEKVNALLVVLPQA